MEKLLNNEQLLLYLLIIDTLIICYYFGTQIQQILFELFKIHNFNKSLPKILDFFFFF